MDGNNPKILMTKKGFKMAPRKKNVVAMSGVNVALLSQIASGVVTRITQTDFATIDHNPPLVIVNTQDIVDGKAAVQITVEGKNMVDSSENVTIGAGDVGTLSVGTLNGTPNFAIITDAALPPRKRTGRAGAPTQYPFAQLEIGQSFFVPKSTQHPNPIKTLASTISAQNAKYSEPTGETEQVERTKRGQGNKAVVDAAGNKVTETVTRQKTRPVRKFSMRTVTAGQNYGNWVAPADGVLIARVAIEA